MGGETGCLGYWRRAALAAALAGFEAVVPMVDAVGESTV